MHCLKTAQFLLLSEWTSSLTWTSAKLGGSTCVFLRWAGYCSDLTGPSCFSWGAVMAVQGRALNTQGPKFEFTLPFLCIHTLTTQPCMYKSLFELFVLAVWTCFCYSPVDIFRNVIFTTNTKPAHTPHTIIQLQVLTAWILSCIFQHTKQSFIASDDLKSVL